MNSNFIHPSAIVEEGVQLGHGNYIGPGCYIKSGVVIGNNNRFEAHVMVGTAPEHREFLGVSGRVVIGHHNVFREFVTIHSGTKDHTTIADYCFLLTKSHVGHDAVLQNHVNLSCGVLVGGHSILFEGCNMGLGSVCHQFSKIGHYSMIGMNAVITKGLDVEPLGVFVGIPAERIRENTYAVQKFMITDENMKAYAVQYYKGGSPHDHH